MIRGDSILKKLEIELKLRGFTPLTIKAYLNHNESFLKFIKKKPEDINTDDIKSYMAFLLENNKKPATVSLVLSSLKFFYKEILEKDLFTKIKAPKSEKKLPTVLTKEEMKRLIDACTNLKHKLLIKLLYSSGLRVSEAVSMRINDFELSEKMGTVRSGKGKKDRVIILSNDLVESIKKYLEKCKNDSEYLFPGFNGHISIRMAQKIVNENAKKADIKKRVFCHALRSSFATHLLEDGVDIRIIQELLGHSSISTTQKYVKVSTAQLQKVISPLDKM